jgi:hypothetical protein
MQKKLLLFILFILLNTVVFLKTNGQNHVLMLQKKRLNKNAYYREGDDIIFYLKGQKLKVEEKIVAIEDSALVFKGYKVNILQISALHVDEKTKWWLRFKPAQLLLIGGTTYLALDIINTGKIDKNTLVISGIMIGVGAVCKILIPNKIKINRKTKLRILNL